MKRFHLDGKDYDYDEDSLFDVTIGEARAIKAATGLTIGDWKSGLVTMTFRGDPDVLAGIVWLVRKRADDPITWNEIDQISTTALFSSVVDLDQNEDKDGEPGEADPGELTDQPALEPVDA